MPPPNDTPEFKVTILGTGTSQGIPVIGCTCPVCTSSDTRNRRLRTSVIIEYEDSILLVDAGPDFRQQMLTNRFSKIDAILLTHEHNDHISGLDDVRPLNFRQQAEMPIYGLPRVLAAVKRRFDYVFDSTYTYPGLPKLSLKELEAGTVTIAGVPLRVIDVMHGQLPVLGFRIGRFCYITDAKSIPPEQLKYLGDLDILILNALHKREHFSHLNLNEALLLIEQVAPRSAYLVHMSHEMGLHAEIEASLPPNVKLAYDGLQLMVT